jgi:preprotein translocase subunit SecF
MELFKQTNFDFLRWKWPFITASLVLSAAGLISIALHGGLRYGIDFKGGAQMTVRFAYPPPIDKIRSALAQKVKSGVQVENLTGAGSENEVVIGTAIEEERQLNINRQAMSDACRRSRDLSQALRRATGVGHRRAGPHRIRLGPAQCLRARRGR